MTRPTYRGAPARKVRASKSGRLPRLLRSAVIGCLGVLAIAGVSITTLNLVASWAHSTLRHSDRGLVQARLLMTSASMAALAPRHSLTRITLASAADITGAIAPAREVASLRRNIVYRDPAPTAATGARPLPNVIDAPVLVRRVSVISIKRPKTRDTAGPGPSADAAPATYQLASADPSQIVGAPAPARLGAVAVPEATPLPRRRTEPPTVADDDAKDPDARTAVYDIAGAAVYMPDGRKLTAHSGLGHRLDNPDYTKVKNLGPTPPNVYRLTMREQLFHGVRAIRLNPIYENKMHGRDGMLAHTYMLGPKGESNGCVSFKDYPKFLHAFLRGEVDRMVVVPDLKTISLRTARARGREADRVALNSR